MSYGFERPEQGNPITAAATIYPDTTGRYFVVSGGTTISTINTGVRDPGQQIWLQFEDAVTVEHDADKLILDGGANLEVEAGTTLMFIVTDTNKVRQVRFGGIEALPEFEEWRNVVIDGGGEELEEGQQVDFIAPFDCEIQEVVLLADQTGSLVVDIWKDTYANYPPTDEDSITDSAPVTITEGIKSSDATLTGWNKTLNAGEVLRVNVDSCTDIERATLALKVLRIF